MSIKTEKQGFTLVELLVVIAIVSLLASIMVPVAGTGMETARRRRAATEMNSIKVAILNFYSDHKYMPWPAQIVSGRPLWVGADAWTADESEQAAVMDLLTGNNAMRKNYLQIPERSRAPGADIVFIDPWGQFYRIGLDRNLDGRMEVSGSGIAGWDGGTVRERVLVYSLGQPGKNKPLKTFDIVP